MVHNLAVLIGIGLLHDKFLMAKLVKRYRRLVCQWMFRRQAEHHGILHKRHGVLRMLLVTAHDNAKIQFPIFRALAHFIRIAKFLHVEHDIRHLLLELHKKVREQIPFHHRRHPEVDDILPVRTIPHHIFLRKGGILHNPLRMKQKHLPLLGETDMLLAAIDEHYPKFRL